MIKFLKIKATDAFSYKDIEFDFRQGLHYVSGLNGSSKTSLFMLIQQGLFNRNAKGCKVDEVNNNITGKPNEIYIEFEKAGIVYTVLNSRKTGKVTLTKDGKDISLRKVPEVLKQIEEILGVDFELFRDLTYQSKNSNLDLIESSTNKGRATFVNNILRLDELDEQFDRLNNRRKRLEGKNGTIATLEETLSHLEASLTEEMPVGKEMPPIDEGKIAKLETKRDKLKEKVLGLQKQIDEFEEQEDACLEYDSLVKKYTRLTTQLAEFGEVEDEEVVEDRKQVAVQALSLLQSQIMVEKAALVNAKKQRTAKAAIQDLQERLDQLNTPACSSQDLEVLLEAQHKKLAEADTRVKQATQRIDVLVKAGEQRTCPTCLSEVSEDKLQAEKQSLHKELVHYSKEAQSAAEEIEKAEEHLATWKKRKHVERDIEKFEAHLQGGESQSEADIERKLGQLEDEVEQLQETLNTVQDSLNRVKDFNKLTNQVQLAQASIPKVKPEPPSTNLEDLETALAASKAEGKETVAALKDLKEQAEAVQAHNANLRGLIAANNQIQQNNKKTKTLIDLKTKEIQKAQETLDALQLWTKILGPKGYRTIKIAQFLKALNATMKKYAELICDSKIVCTFALTDTGEITFTVSDGAKTQDISLWSGGESARIKMVCLFAVLEMMEAMGAASFNVLCLDEVFSALDQEGKDGLFKVLDYLKQKQKAVYVIAHEELALDNAYDSVVKAEKLRDGTTRIYQT